MKRTPRETQKHLVGDLRPGKAETIKKLLHEGYLEERNGNVVMTAKGHQYCEEFRAEATDN